MNCMKCGKQSMMMSNRGMCMPCDELVVNEENSKEVHNFEKTTIIGVQKICSICGVDANKVAFVDHEGICRQCKIENQANMITGDSEVPNQEKEIVRTPVILGNLDDTVMRENRLYDIDIQEKELENIQSRTQKTTYKFDSLIGEIQEHEEDDKE